MARLAKLEDARAVARVHVGSWQAGYRGIFPDEFLDSLDEKGRARWWEQRLAEGRGGTFVAERSGEIVGYSSLTASDIAGWGEVLAIYVAPDHWGLGVGHELMNASIQWFEHAGFEKALLWVTDNNARARRFYERQGWSLGRPIRIETIGGVDVTLVRYERDPLAGT
jgi:GNAT superfamily N-acetyltransferase